MKIFRNAFDQEERIERLVEPSFLLSLASPLVIEASIPSTTAPAPRKENPITSLSSRSYNYPFL